MYRPQIILARNISIELPRRKSSPGIARNQSRPFTRHRYRTQSTGCCAVLAKSIERRTVELATSAQPARNRTAEISAIGASATGIKLATTAVALQFGVRRPNQRPLVN